MVIGLWKDLYINILCLILPVVGRSSSTVRGSRTNTDKTLLHDVNERSARECIAAKLNLGRPGKSRCFHNGALARSGWWRQTGSNRRPEACKATALPTELCPQLDQPHVRLRLSSGATAFVMRRACQDEAAKQRRLVGLGRLELPTSRLSSARSNQLSYRPNSASAPLCDLKERETKTAVSRKWDLTWSLISK